MKEIKKIEIPYGNWGFNKIEVPVYEEYRNYFLIVVDGKYEACSSVGLILLRNRLNEHLPDLNQYNWKEWVDWVWTLDGNRSNTLSGTPDFTGGSPFVTVETARCKT